MTTTEAARHRLYEEARHAMSDESADTLMALLPPVGWADVARQRDVDLLREHVDARFDQQADRLSAQFHKELLRTVVAANVGTTIAVGTLVLAAVKFA